MDETEFMPSVRVYARIPYHDLHAFFIPVLGLLLNGPSLIPELVEIDLY